MFYIDLFSKIAQCAFYWSPNTIQYNTIQYNTMHTQYNNTILF